MKSTVLTLFILPFLLSINFQPNAKTVFEKNPVVLELFTSQGCSSCPPADKLLKDVKSNDVIALSYHVDYWNYIGWKDPFSKDRFTNKQRAYGTKFYSSTIYTPQLVVNGREHFVGSDRQKLKLKIEKYSKFEANSKINVSDVFVKGTSVNFSYAIKGLKADDNLRIALVIDERVTYVKRGENRNRGLVNNNIVVAEQKFKVVKDSGKGSIIIPQIVKDSDNLSLVLILENDALDINAAVQTNIVATR